MPYTGSPLRKYATLLDGTTAGSVKVRMSIRKAGSADFATGSDWTPASGDVKVSIDGGAQANIGTLPSYSNGAWEFVLTALELTGKEVKVNVVDSATKAVDDDEFVIHTFGHASAMYPTVYSGGAAGNLLTSGTGTDQLNVSGGIADANVKKVNGTTVTGTGTVDANVVSMASGTITAASIATDAITAAKIASDAETEIAAAVAAHSTLVSINTNAGNAADNAVAAYADTQTLVGRLTSARAGHLDNLSAGAVALQGTLSTVATYVDTEVAAIKAKTDLIPAAPAAVGDIPTASAIVTAVFAGTADGDSLTTHLTNLRAMAQGTVSVTDNGNGTYTMAFKKADGTTNAFSKTYNPTTGARS